MKAITREWVDKAEADYNGVLVLLRSRKKGRLDLICFLAQQCAEKYIKARLAEDHIAFPKTHELPKLLHLVQPLEPLWISMASQLATLSNYAINPRYPGKFASLSESREAVKTVRQFRVMARAALGA